MHGQVLTKYYLQPRGDDVPKILCAQTLTGPSLNVDIGL